MNNLLPSKRLLGVLQVLNRREVVLVLLHGSHPRHVVKGDDLEAEVLVVANFLDFTQEGGEIGRRDVVDVGEEVRRCELFTC
jgi:hypothetical protein